MNSGITLNYLLLAHKDLHQLDDLIRRLTGSNTYFFVHLDKKLPARDCREFDFWQDPRVKIIPKKIDIKWAGYSMVEATLLLMKEAVRSRNKGYYILLSGQDIPVETNERISVFFQENYGKEFIECHALPFASWGMEGGLDRLSYHWFIDQVGFEESKLLYLLQKQNDIRRNYFEEFPPFGGSQWWCLTQECVRYIFRFIKANPILLNFFATTVFSDELFFQTIIANSPFADKIVNDNLRFINFKDGHGHPQYLTEEDIVLAKQSGKFWARKYQLPV